MASRYTITRFRDYFEKLVSKEVTLLVANKAHSMRHTAFQIADIKE